MATDNGRFLSRWARRKAEARVAQERDERPAEDTRAPLAPSTTPDAAARMEAPAADQPLQDAASPPQATNAQPASEADAPRLPTLEDLAALTHDSDFSAFVQPAVAPEVKLAAFKKLFSDPHYNVMDGLDVYIDDYSSPEVLPATALKKMVSARVLALVEDEPEAPPAAPPAGDENAPHDAVGGSPATAPLAGYANNAAAGSVLESEGPADADGDGQTHFDFPEPDRRT
ncbi:MAG: DUF3306 domain-containing protein [Pigmentiphaga sp.]|uniref:DUF3306 domain-containing protein n=1 Tax=Pigmentiphaga sp. TaxID=1977564 RepID=UPI0029B5AECD|nr:DUF3306 domain-containing protein [Pigmentiphaga sp.]MDX3906536.1 DUF3306 domain-containing protein [Pigmentiphaga sp.]